jgi:hypothetical protein
MRSRQSSNDNAPGYWKANHAPPSTQRLFWTLRIKVWHSCREVFMRARREWFN